MLNPAKDRPSATPDLRRLNLSRVLNHLRDHGPAARSEVATATGLVRGSITGLVNLLSEEGLVREVDESLSRGRPAPKIAIDGAHRAVLVLELLVDRFTVLACDLSERTIFDGHARHQGARSTPDEILDVGAGLVREGIAAVAAAGARLDRVTVVVAAPVIEDTGLVPISIDMDWHDVDLRGMLASRMPEIRCPIRFASDARIGGWAEYQHLRRAGFPDLSDMIYLKSDTGIGGIHIAGGSIVEGARNLSFAVGHISLDPAGELCACGQKGCFVTFAGPEVVVTQAGLADMLDAHGQTAAEHELLTLARNSDERALAALQAAGEWIGRFLNIAVLAADPGAVILGGYWADALPYLLPGIRSTMLQTSVDSSLHQDLPILPAALGSRANIEGAADTAIRDIFDWALTEREPFEFTS